MTTTTTFLVPTTSIDPVRRRRIRLGLVAFGLTTAAGVTGLHLLARSSGADLARLDQAPLTAQLALFAPAFVPTVAMLVAWLVSRIAPDWGLRRCGRRTLAVAWVIPVVAAVLAYVPAWMLGLAGYDPAGLQDSAAGLPAALGVLLALLPGLVPWMVLASGEQLGWSSWLVVRLAEIADRRLVAPAFGM